MKREDRKVKKVQAELGGELVDDLFIQPLRVVNMGLLTKLDGSHPQDKLLIASEKILLLSLVDEKGKQIYKEFIPFALEDIMDLINQVAVVNTPQGKSKLAKEEQPNT